MTEQKKVGRAVHRLKSPVLLLNVELKHVIGVVLEMTGCLISELMSVLTGDMSCDYTDLPQANIEHVRGLDLLVVTLAVL